MEMTPRRIEQAQFHDTFRGYSHEEVDAFLDEVAAAFDHVYRENQAFHHRLRGLEEEIKTARATEDMLKRTLITAQKTAEEAVEEAKAKAQETLAGAERKAADLVAEAEQRAASILEGAVNKQRELEVGLEGLKRFDREYRARLKAFIESQLQVLAEGPAPAGEPSPSPQAEKPSPSPEAEKPSGSPPGEGAGLVGASQRASAPASEMKEGSRQTSQTPEAAGSPPEEEAEDERTIKKLFWGDD